MLQCLAAYHHRRDRATIYMISKSHQIGKGYNLILRLIRHLNIARIATPEELETWELFL